MDVYKSVTPTGQLPFYLLQAGGHVSASPYGAMIPSLQQRSKKQRFIPPYRWRLHWKKLSFDRPTQNGRFPTRDPNSRTRHRY